MTRQRGGLVPTLATLLASTLLLSFVSSAAEAQLHRVSKLTVFDANNKLVGLVHGLITNLTFDSPIHGIVAFERDGQVAAVPVNQNGFFPTSFLYFEAPDTNCSGTPPMVRPSPYLLPSAAIGPPGTMPYMPDPSATPQTKNFASRSFNRDCFASSGSAQLVPAQALGDLGTFTAPFSVRAN